MALSLDRAKPSPRPKDERPELVAKATVPDIPLRSHGAVSGFTFYTGTQFGEKYRNGIFLRDHRSWNRPRRVGYSLAFVPLDAIGKAAGPTQNFLTVFVLDPNSKEVRGRPADVLQIPDGSLPMCDGGANVV